MKKEVRTVCYDEELKLEAYRFEGIVQPFPNHFHDHYVIGLMEVGERMLTCKNEEYRLKPGNIIIFNPGDNHACAQVGAERLDYRGINIPSDTMLRLAEEITGVSKMPGFQENVVWNEEAKCYLQPLHQWKRQCELGFPIRAISLGFLVDLLDLRQGFIGIFLLTKTNYE